MEKVGHENTEETDRGRDMGMKMEIGLEMELSSGWG